MARSQTFPIYGPSAPVPGSLNRAATTYSISQRPKFSSSDPSYPPRKSPTSFSYHSQTSPIPIAFEPVLKSPLAPTRQATETIAATEDTKPDKSKRFLSTKLNFIGSVCEGKNTIFTFASANSTLATIFNSLTLGLSAPLCRVYFVEILFEGRQIVGEDYARYFSERIFGFNKLGAPTTGEDIVRWLEYQKSSELREFGFEKLQGNSFAVYLLTIPVSGASVPDTIHLRKGAEKRYKFLDGLDNIVMLGGRFHNSVWSLFK